MIEQLNKYEFCLQPNAKYPLLDEIGDHFMDHAVQLVKSGVQFVYVLDNIDWEEKAHDVRTDSQNKSVHAVASSVVFCHIPSSDLPDDGPQKDLETCHVREVVKLSQAEKNSIRHRYRILLARILFEHFPELCIFQPYIYLHILNVCFQRRQV